MLTTCRTHRRAGRSAGRAPSTLDADVIIRRQLIAGPAADHEGLRRQRLQERLLLLLEQHAPGQRPGQRPRVDRGDQLPDRRSSSVKNTRLRRAARILVSTTWTPFSTLALSLGRRTRVGTT